jgi:hypothetical protein
LAIHRKELFAQAAFALPGAFSAGKPASATVNRLVNSVRATGAIGVVGVFLLEDPKSPDSHMKKGRIAFDFGTTCGRHRGAAPIGEPPSAAACPP